MSRRLPLILLLIALPLWLAASYGARYGFMEDGQWVGICADEASRRECPGRSNTGQLIHFKGAGWCLAVLGLVFGFPALALYNTTFAVFAVVIAGLRLVRKPRAV